MVGFLVSLFYIITIFLVNYKIQLRGSESATAKEGEISLPRPRTLAISSIAFFKRSKFQTDLEFSCENLAFLFLNERRGSRSQVAPTENYSSVSVGENAALAHVQAH